MNRPDTNKTKNWLAFLLIAAFIALSLLPDLRPLRTVRFYYDWFERPNIDLLDMEFEIDPAMRYSPGFGRDSFRSLAYLSAVKFFHLLIPYRLICLRVLSVTSSCLALFALYRLALRLFSGTIALLFLLLLTTSPMYVESMRAYGFIPLTNMVVTIACYFLAASINGRQSVIKVLLLALTAVASLSLYKVGTLVIFFPLIFYGLYWKAHWRKLLLFVAATVAVITVLDVALGEPGFNYQEFVLGGREWLQDHPEQADETYIGRVGLKARLLQNVEQAAGYLFQIDRSYFSTKGDWEHRQRLFNVVYTPFFWLGLLISLWKRKKSHVFLLIWFFLFFMVPFFSSGIHHIRIVQALNPIYFFITLGLYSTFAFLKGKYPTGQFRKAIPAIFLAVLALTAGYDIYEYFGKVTKPYYNYSRSQLEQLTKFISEQADQAESIFYNERMADLIWGNPWFDSRFSDIGFISRMNLNNQRGRPIGIERQVRLAAQEGGDALFILAYPYSEADCHPEEEYSVPLNFIGGIPDEFGDTVSVIRINGMEEICFIYVKKQSQL